VHVLHQAVLGDGEADFALEDLEGVSSPPSPPGEEPDQPVADCTVFLLGTLRALRLRRLRGCTVVAAAVAGSAFVDSALRCTMHLAARQVRIHDVEDTDFYLVRRGSAAQRRPPGTESAAARQRVRSHPIIEGTTRVRFAPYAFSHAAVCAAQAAAGLGPADEAAWRDAWAQVDDFAWLRVSQSPNWALLPEGERSAAPGVSVE